MSRGALSASVSSSVPRALAVLEYLAAASSPPSSRQIAERFEIPPSTLTALLSALRTLDYVTVENGLYHPGPRLLGLGHLTSRNASVLGVRTALEVLVTRTRETAFFSILVDRTDDDVGNVLPVEQIESSDTVRYVGLIGRRLAAVRSAAGLAILTSLSDVTDTAYENAVQQSENFASRAQLTKHLEAIRRRGFAFETPPGESSTSASVPLLHSGKVLGALSVAGPIERMAALEPDLAEIFSEALGAAERSTSPGSLAV